MQPRQYREEAPIQFCVGAPFVRGVYAVSPLRGFGEEGTDEQGFKTPAYRRCAATRLVTAVGPLRGRCPPFGRYAEWRIDCLFLEFFDMPTSEATVVF